MSEQQATNETSTKNDALLDSPFSVFEEDIDLSTIPRARRWVDEFDFGPLGLRERHAAIEKSAQADPANIQEVGASQLAIVNSYYESGLYQSRQSFRWSLIWGGVGFVFFIFMVAVLVLRQPGEVALASGLAGTVLEVFAGTYLYLYKHASDQLASFRNSLERTQYLLLTNSLCERLHEDNEQEMKMELIRRVFDLISVKC